MKKYLLSKKIAALITLILSVTTNNSIASSVDNAKIKEIHVNRVTGEIAYIRTLPKNTNKISCHTGGFDYALPLVTDLDRLVYSSLLASYATQNDVKIVGNGNCSNLHGAIETLRAIYVR